METRNVRIDAEYIDLRKEDIKPGRYVMLAISDTGDGMTQTTLTKLFEPFYTTRPVGKGSGLGLSMVFGFVRQSFGAIRVYSELGAGSTLKLYFPVAAAEPAPNAPAKPLPKGRARGETLLVVEDEADVRRVLARQLRKLDFNVIEAANGDLAYGQLTSGITPDLMITDIVMPGSLQGPELAEKARRLLPDMRVIFVSGYPTEAAIHGNGLRPTDRHLIKPVTEAELIGNVFEAFKAQQGPES